MKAEIPLIMIELKKALPTSPRSLAGIRVSIAPPTPSQLFPALTAG
jgi:hypothetical protein